MQELFVEVMLPLAVPNLFTYRVPPAMAGDIAVGKRVIVPFGRQKIYSGLVRRTRSTFKDSLSVRDIHSVLDDFPVVNEKQFAFWDWMASYYLCTLGEVMNSALPAALKLQSETIVLAQDVDKERSDLTANEETLMEALSDKKELSISELAKILNVSSIHQILKRALDKHLVIMTEEINERYKPRVEKHLRLAAKYKEEAALEEVFSEMEADARKAKQENALTVFMKYLFDDPDKSSVKKNVLASHEGVSASSVTTLISRGIIEEFDVIVDRIPVFKGKLLQPYPLSKAQDKALDDVNESNSKHDVTLLHGVTSSGKTEIYIHLIDAALKEGKQVLYLLPEIALTTQLISRLQKFFGDKVGVYHSRYGDNERVEVWNNVLNFYPDLATNKAQIVIGARSCQFLPFSDLGLVIIDEEHDHSFKQSHPAPRYQGRDSAIMLAHMHGAKTVLGSATPSLESYFNALNERYGLVRLQERYGGIQMPEIIVADVKEARRKKIMKSHFTPELLSDIKSALDKKEQIILFQNRRGFSNFIECSSCDWIPHCKNCSVTLTYHKHSNMLKCHYCGYSEQLPSSCSNCGDRHLEVKGFGTEKIEEEIAIFFPDARIARMDLDTTRTKSSFQKIIGDFEEQKVDILVGTQMVTKGLDFDNVSTIGIVNADQLLNFPDFRAFERSYQLMAQVSGRSGRKNKRGRVIIQTTQPDHWVINDVVRNDYENFYNRDLKERMRFGYPPLSRLIEITLKHKENEMVHEASEVFSELLRKKLGARVIGPNIPLIIKIKNLYHRTIFIKIEKSASPAEVKNIVVAQVNEFYSNRTYSTVKIIADVDPV